VKGREYLLELLSDVIIIYEDMIRGERPGNEPGVTGEDHPGLLQRDTDDLVIAYGPVVEDVEPQKSHPLCQTAKHDISDEFHEDLPPATKA